MNNIKKTVSGIALKELVVGSLIFKGINDLSLTSEGKCQRAIITNCICSGDIDQLKVIFESRNIDLEDRDEDGNTYLMVASGQGNVEIVSLLLSHGSDSTAENDEGLTALHVAADAGHTEVCREILEHNNNAKVDAKDTEQWTPFTWACYRGHTKVAELLLSKGADVNARGVNQISGLVWAAGRGFAELVRLLLGNNAKVDLSDRYGTTALIWSARKGRKDIVEMLLKAGASVDASGMYSWTPLLVATMGNHMEVVDLLLGCNPNVNVVDKDGMTALAIASKEGFEDIALKLISVGGAYINLQDKSGDTNLIHASKAGHFGIVDALLVKFADVNVKGKDHKTCLHWAIDKGHSRIVKLILSARPDLEAKTADGETPLLRAVRARNADIVQMLLDKKAKIQTTDKKGDTALHIAMRSRSKTIVEVLLRNPKHSQLLYRPNRQGETPYSIDVNSPKTILGQVFGSRRLNTNEDNENILGYDLYSSALADILTEPSLSMPITVGLYAKWGSGKSFLLRNLRREMKNFAREWVNPTFKMSPLLFFVLFQVTVAIGVLSWAAVAFGSSQKDAIGALVGITTSFTLLVISHLFVFVIYKSSFRYDWTMLYGISVFLTKHFNAIKLVLNVLFSHPPTAGIDATLNLLQPLRLFFTDQTKVVASTDGENSVTLMIGSLLDEIEGHYGKVATRLYRALRPKPESASTRWRRFCCIPYIFLYLIVFFGTMTSVVLLCLFLRNVREYSIYEIDYVERKVQNDLILGFLFAVSSIVGAILLANLYTIVNCLQSLLFSHRRHLQRALSRLDVVKSEGHLQAVKMEVNLMLDMVRCLDAFTGQQSRLVVVVDGLDSCEQSKVLSVLDAVHMLFSDPGAPFIILLAIDPHVITKAIALNLHQAFSQTNIGGNAYIKNLVHLPFFLQNSGLRKVKAAQLLAVGARTRSSMSATANWMESDESGGLRRLSVESAAFGVSAGRMGKYQKKYSRAFKQRDSVCSSIGSNLNLNRQQQHGPQDLTKVLLNDDYFNDVNPRSMRRLMNVVYVMGRLLKAFQIDFNWYHLATWVNITEQWPYRLSWIILYSEMHESELDDNVALKDLYDRVKYLIPTQKDVEPLLEYDRDEKKLDTFLAFHRKQMTLVELKIFLPFTINLDPYVKKVIKEEIQDLEERGLLGAEDVVSAPAEFRHNVFPNASGRMRNFVPQIMQPNSQTPNLLQQFWPPLPPDMQYPPPEPTPDIEIPEDAAKTPLSEMTVDQVCQMLRSIRGIKQSCVDTYCATMVAQNLSGAVLANCSLDELRNVVVMNFGDWELFRMVVQTLRQMERRRQISSRPFRGGMTANCTTDEEEDPSVTEEKAKRHHHQTPLERQVNMEDAMISGLLSTLNEEAHEDVECSSPPVTAAGLADSSESVDADSAVVFLTQTSTNSYARVKPEFSVLEEACSRAVSPLGESVSRASSLSDVGRTMTSREARNVAIRNRYHSVTGAEKTVSFSLANDDCEDPYAWLSKMDRFDLPPRPVAEEAKVRITVEKIGDVSRKVSKKLKVAMMESGMPTSTRARRVSESSHERTNSLAAPPGAAGLFRRFSASVASKRFSPSVSRRPSTEDMRLEEEPLGIRAVLLPDGQIMTAPAKD